MGRKVTKEICILRIQEKHGNKFDLSNINYVNMSTPITLVCPIHGEYQATPENILRSKYGCAKCSGNVKKTTEDFIKEANKIHNNQYDYSQSVYTSALNKVDIICHAKDKYGYEHGLFQQIASEHLSGKKCPKCSKVFRYNTKSFIEEAYKVHNNKYDYSKVNYTGIFNSVTITCLEHGDFYQTPHTHLRGSGCPKCASIKQGILQRSTTNDFINKAKLVHGNTFDYSKVEYITSIQPITIICKKHGEFTTTPNKHLSGGGCPTCHESTLEEEVRLCLESLNIEFITEKHFDWMGLQRLDFYLPKYNIAIECLGIQHFIDCPQYFGNSLEANQKRDKLKKEKCDNNNVKIYYFTHHPFDTFLEEPVYHDILEIIKIIQSNE